MISSMGLLPEFGVFAKRAAPVFSLALTSTQDNKKNERLRRYIPLHRSRTAIKYDDAIMSSSPPPPLPRHMAPPRDHLSMSRRSLSPQQLAILDSPKHKPKGKDYDSDGSVGSRNSRRSHRSLGSNVSMEGLGPIGSNIDTLGPFVADIQKGDEIKSEPDRIPTVEEAAIDVATFLVDDYEARTRAPASTAEILASLDSEISAERSPSPLPTQSLPLFSIDPSQSILSEEALVQLRTASVRGCKVGLGTNWHDHVVLQDSKKSTKKAPLIETSDVDCAEAAYEIAKKLVLWSENIVITDDQKSPAGLPMLDDVDLDLAELDELESFDGSDSRGSMSDGESENESEGETPSTTTDSQWISATEYFERRRAEYMLSKLSFNPAQEQPRL